MKIIHLLPINPVPTTYGRMGDYGQPVCHHGLFRHRAVVCHVYAV